ncbi:MAG: efflux RND transporter periplasmic adaptor subunit [Gemmatimonadetes bacterium]|nr:efflux RND transporter periplasmic adaptor subunit [Gemmatimonadota bacterium]
MFKALSSLRLLPLLAIAACAPALPGARGARPVAARPDTLWVPGREAPPRLAAAELALPPDLVARREALTLEDVVALALEGNPEVRAAWATARSRAAAYGAARAGWFPTISGEASATRLQTSATQGRSAVEQTVYEPSVSFTWLLLDAGGRGGAISAAREGLVAANWTHNATLQAVVARTAGAFFEHAAAKALLTAQRVTVSEATTNLAAAEERRRVGVATIADVLQARTALAQARLDLQSIEGNLYTTRGALAAATGYPATLAYDIDTAAVERRAAGGGSGGFADRAGARAAPRPRRLPRAVRAGPGPGAGGGRRAASLAGGRRQRGGDLAAGAERRPPVVHPAARPPHPALQRLCVGVPAGAGRRRRRRRAGRADGLAQQVIFQVFSAYYALQTAALRVATADELLASATESAAAARGRYQSGVGSLLELLTAENALAGARAQRIQARLGWQASLVALAQNAGVLDLRGGSPLRLRQDVPVVLPATGTVEPIQTAAVAAQVDGIVERLAFQEGDEVRQGEVLFRIDPRPYAAELAQQEAVLARDLVQLANALRDQQRMEDLAGKEYVTQQQVDQARSTAAALAATVRADSAQVARARLDLDRASVRAPITGLAGAVLVRAGNLVRAGTGQPLVLINQMSPILVRFGVPASELPGIRRAGAGLRVTAAPVGDSGPPQQGTLTFVDNAVDSLTGTILLKASFPNTGRALWPGALVRVVLTVTVERGALVAPVSALITGQQGTRSSW